ncbi:hypothetical protein P0Y31_09500 [Knoellia sp. 3-2P3]|nr:hypothetical protein [Knoellia sp. 3-2P3]
MKTADGLNQPAQQQPKRRRSRRRGTIDVGAPVVVVSRPVSDAKPAHLALLPAKQLKDRRFAGEDWFEQRKHEE